jgi:hypothetical protein
LRTLRNCPAIEEAATSSIVEEDRTTRETEPPVLTDSQPGRSATAISGGTVRPALR